MRVKRPELVLAGAVLICSPMIPGILSGAVTPEAALIRLLMALVACWVGGSVLSHVLTRYQAESRRTEILRSIIAARTAAAERAAAASAGTPGTDPHLGGPVPGPAG